MLINLHDTDVGFVWDGQKDYAPAAQPGSLAEIPTLEAPWPSQMCICPWVTMAYDLATYFMLHQNSKL